MKKVIEYTGSNTTLGEKIAMLHAQNPEKPLLWIGKELKRIGLITNERSIYKIVRTDVKCQRDLEQIRQLNEGRLTRDIVPLALSEVEGALKDKKYPRDKKFKFTKLALDKEFGADESKRPIYPTQVNIGMIQQVIQQGNARRMEELQAQGETVIDVSGEDS